MTRFYARRLLHFVANFRYRHHNKYMARARDPMMHLRSDRRSHIRRMRNRPIFAVFTSFTQDADDARLLYDPQGE